MRRLAWASPGTTHRAQSPTCSLTPAGLAVLTVLTQMSRLVLSACHSLKRIYGRGERKKKRTTAKTALTNSHTGGVQCGSSWMSWLEYGYGVPGRPFGAFLARQQDGGGPTNGGGPTCSSWAYDSEFYFVPARSPDGVLWNPAMNYPWRRRSHLLSMRSACTLQPRHSRSSAYMRIPSGAAGSPKIGEAPSGGSKHAGSLSVTPLLALDES